MFDITLRWRDSHAPISAATLLSMSLLSDVTAPIYAPTNAVSSASPSAPMLWRDANAPEGYLNFRPEGAADPRTPLSAA